jgi:hypothetical protein
MRDINWDAYEQRERKRQEQSLSALPSEEIVKIAAEAVAHWNRMYRELSAAYINIAAELISASASLESCLENRK